MAKVYVSSTVADLKAEREAVMEWLVTAGHQPVHSYRPDSETVRESCLDDVQGCDLYLLILGHRYGFQPGDENPDKLSITQLEYRRAKGKPRIALLRTSIPDIGLSDIADPEKFKRVQAFREEVQHEVRPAEFRDAQGLIQALSTGVQSELQKRQRGGQIDVPQVSPNDPAVLQIIATLTRQIDSKDAETTALRSRVEELEMQLRAAVARTLTAAAQPGATAKQVRAAEALQEGNTEPAEALLRDEERAAVSEARSPQVTRGDEAAARHRAAELAREQGALAFGHDARTALAAYHRAAEQEPDDTWTHFFIGDLHITLGDLASARSSYGRAASEAEKCRASDPDDLDAQRDLSVSHNKIGNVLVAQGDGPAALAAYRKGLAIAEALAARDPADAQWQTDVAVSCAKLGALDHAQSVETRRDYLLRGREVLLKLKSAGRLMANQDWTEWFEQQLGQLPPGQS